jgi:hypothetical protein
MAPTKAARVKQQIRLQELERKRMINKLKSKNNYQHVSEDDLKSALAHSKLERISNLLPKQMKESKPFRMVSQPKGNQDHKKALKRIPYIPLKKNVHWLNWSQQEPTSSISLTEELEMFAEYVGVSYHLLISFYLILSNVFG